MSCELGWDSSKPDWRYLSPTVCATDKHSGPRRPQERRAGLTVIISPPGVNPYHPPSAPLDQLSKERPKAVKVAAICLWVSSLLAFLVTAAQVTGLVPDVGPSTGATAVGGLLTAALLGIIAGNINEGRRWARWLFIVIYAIGTPASVAAIIMAPAYFVALPAVLQANMLVQFVLQKLALVLVFASASRDWFTSKHAITTP